jgi:uncharacterized protein YacL
MDRSTRTAVLWRIAGFACYAVGLILSVLTVVNAYFAPPASSFANVSLSHIVGLFASLLLIAVGRTISWKYGDEVDAAVESTANPWQKPQQSRLEELGYHIPPEESEQVDQGYAYEDGEVFVVCRECGEENEPGFEFCGNCTARLPD